MRSSLVVFGFPALEFAGHIPFFVKPLYTVELFSIGLVAHANPQNQSRGSRQEKTQQDFWNERSADVFTLGSTWGTTQRYLKSASCLNRDIVVSENNICL